MGDFRAFYCAARVASHGGDPYHTEPLRVVRDRDRLEGVLREEPGRNDSRAAARRTRSRRSCRSRSCRSGSPRRSGALLLLLAWIACIARSCDSPAYRWDVALGVFALSLGVLSLPFGEVVPLALAFICLAAYCAWRGGGAPPALLRRRRDDRAASRASRLRRARRLGAGRRACRCSCSRSAVSRHSRLRSSASQGTSNTLRACCRRMRSRSSRATRSTASPRDLGLGGVAGGRRARRYRCGTSRCSWSGVRRGTARARRRATMRSRLRSRRRSRSSAERSST